MVSSGSLKQKKGRKEKKEEGKEGGMNKRTQGEAFPGILTLHSPYEDTLLLFISSVSPNKSHKCGECHDMHVIL